MTTHRPAPETPHLGSFTSKRTGNTISVQCWCPIGHDHSYPDWQPPSSPDITDTATD